MSLKPTKLDRQAALDELPIPSNVNCIRFSSRAWARLAAHYTYVDDKGITQSPLVNARGIVQNLFGRKPGSKSLLPIEVMEGRDEAVPEWGDLSAEEFKAQLLLIALSDPDMREIELGHAAKFGAFHQECYTTWHNKVTEYWNPVKAGPDIDLDLLDVAKQVLAERLKALLVTWELTPIEEAYARMDKTTNSGFPHFSKSWASKPDIVSNIKATALRIVAGEDVLRRTPHILFKRATANGATSKMRPVQCPPKAESLAAKMFTTKIIEGIRQDRQFCGFHGGENVHEHIKEMWDRKYVFEGDFSSFDTNVTFLMPHILDILVEVFPDHVQYFQNVWKYYMNGVVITPVGVLLSSDPNGLLSGDGWTSIVGTIANALSVWYTMSKLGYHTSEYDVLSYGDDIAMAFDEPLDLEKFELTMLDLGMVCNQSKQSMETGPKRRFSFLGYHHFAHRANSPVFPIMRLASTLYFDKKFTRKEDYLIPEDADVTGLQVKTVGTIMKLNLTRNHAGFDKLCAFAVANHHTRLHPSRWVKATKWAILLKDQRTSRTLSIYNSPIFAAIFTHYGFKVEHVVGTKTKRQLALDNNLCSYDVTMETDVDEELAAVGITFEDLAF